MQTFREIEARIQQDKKRATDLKHARFILRWWWLCLPLLFTMLLYTAHDWLKTPVVESLPGLLSVIGVFILLSASVHQAQGTVRNDGVEPRNPFVLLGFLLCWGSWFLSSNYRHGHTVSFYLISVVIMLLGIIACLLVAWRDFRNAWRQRRQSQR